VQEKRPARSLPACPAQASRLCGVHTNILRGHVAGGAGNLLAPSETRIFPGSEFPVRLRFLLRSRNIDSRRKKQRRRGEGRGIESPNSNPHLAAPTGADRVPFDCPRRPGVLSSLPRMSTEAGELLGIDPLELRFPFELNKQISCTLQLTNKTDKQVAFKVKTTSPKKYCVRPNNGIVVPRSTADVVVTMQAQREAPPDMQCKDKFLVQSAIVAKEIVPKEVTGDMVFCGSVFILAVFLSHFLI